MRTMLCAAVVLTSGTAAAQELDARAYSPSPIGMTIVVGGFGGSKGGILFDPSLDVADVHADLRIVTAGVGYTFSLAGRQARALAVFPMASGTIAGEVQSLGQSQHVAGLVDPRIKLSVGLRGAPALTMVELARAPRRMLVGASLTAMLPLGQYDPESLVNLGYHRWAFKPEIGASRTAGRWTIEGIAGVWLFTTNVRAFPGHTRKEQKPLYSVQGHLSYALPHRTWIALDGTWFAGGETRVERVTSPDRQRNMRIGGTLSIPMGGQQSLKLTYSTGTTTRRGTDFDTLMITWQLLHF